ncbi:DNA polymerase III subunit delta [bacterium]|nr:DNA polymerase III subunit delta [bacterium]NIN91984.1 DNA polymerase III subunit delta [bacterium]NIO18200.1 DNA polymerase III subunit delta [bacterium]NIO73174.1 DNA polymerase III subunit delta [bacterium]
MGTMMKYKELITKLKKKEIANCYFFCGEEDYLKQEAILSLKKMLIKPEAQDFDFGLLYAEDISAKEVISLAETYPFMSKRRLVVVKGIDKFTESELKEIVKYLKNPISSTCLVLESAKVKKEGLARGIYKTISSLCETVIFWRLFDTEIPGWIENKISREGKTISPQAAHYLFVEAGNNLLDLSGEIEKLLIYTRDRKKVILDDVEQLIGRSMSDSIFDLLRAITRKNLTRSLEILAKLTEAGEKPVGILARIAKRIRQIIYAKELMRQREKPANIIEEVGLHPFFDKDFPSQIQNFSRKELLNNFHQLLRADWEIKVGRKPAQLVLELLIMNLCGEKTASAYSG